MRAEGYSIEVTSAAARTIPSFAELLPSGTRVFVPHLPNTRLADISATAVRLVREGMVPVPHVAARHIREEAALATHLRTLLRAGVREVLLIGGDRSRPLGAFADAGALIGPARAFGRVYFAGHPEGADDRILLERIADRCSHGDAAVVTQFVFESGPLLAWAARFGAPVPVRAGLPGIADVRTLLRYARSCGVAASLRGLARGRGLLRMAGGWSPEALIREISAGPFEGPHFFPFGGLPATAGFLADLEAAGQAPSPARRAGG